MQRDRKYNDEKLNRAQEELCQYRKLQREIEHLKAKANEYRERYDYGLRAQQFDLVKVAGGEYYDRMVETVIKWAELEHEAEMKRVEAERTLWRIDDKLRRLCIAEKAVLELYYIKGKNLQQVANIMMYSYYGIRDLKHRALEKYAKIKVHP